jgi:hypothetical protein
VIHERQRTAANGSPEARNELKEMVPFYSWLLLGPKIKEKWDAQDFYGAGKEAWTLMQQAAGDVTMFFPVIKGAAAGISMVGQEMKVVFAQGMRKLESGRFKRVIQKSAPETPGDLGRKIDDSAADIGHCFPAGTLVLMADGSSRPIELVRLGDRIMSDNPEDDLPAAARVVDAVYEGSTDRLVTLSFDEDGDGSADLSFRDTREHPIWTFDAGWVDAAELTPGDRVLDAQRKSMTVTSTSQVRVTCATWNLNVAGDHAFFVGDGMRWVLVHNLNAGPRTWVQYEIEFELNGKTYFYNGRTSAYGQVDNAWDIFSTKRYKNGFARTVYEMDTATGLVKRDPVTGKKIAIGTVSFNREELDAMRRSQKLRFEKPQYSDGTTGMVTLTDSRGRPRSYSPAELAVRGAEHLKDAARRRQGKSANDNVPLRGHPAIDQFKNAAKIFKLPPRIKC